MMTTLPSLRVRYSNPVGAGMATTGVLERVRCPIRTRRAAASAPILAAARSAGVDLLDRVLGLLEAHSRVLAYQLDRVDLLAVPHQRADLGLERGLRRAGGRSASISEQFGGPLAPAQREAERERQHDEHHQDNDDLPRIKTVTATRNDFRRRYQRLSVFMISYDLVVWRCKTYEIMTPPTTASPTVAVTGTALAARSRCWLDLGNLSTGIGAQISKSE